MNGNHSTLLNLTPADVGCAASHKVWAACGLFIIALALLSGCASPTIKVSRIHPGPDAARESVVKVYKEGSAPPGPCEVLGVVSAFGEFKGANESALKKLQREAAAMGADSLLGYYKASEHGALDYTLSSALAARALPSGQSTPRRLAPMVAVTRPSLGEKMRAGRKASLVDEAAQGFARLLLAEKGYYATKVEQTAPEPLETALGAIGDLDAVDQGGPQADLVLGIRFGSWRTSTVVVEKGAYLTLEAILYSRSQGKVIWQNTASTGYSTEVWFDAVTPNQKRLSSVYGTLRKAFVTLPDMSTKTTK